MTALKPAAFFLAVFLLAAPSPAAAEALTWQQCLEEAYHNNPEVAAVAREVSAAKARHRASRSPMLPQLAASAGSETLDSSRESHNAGLTLRQNLFSGGRNSAGIRQAQAELEATEARLAAARASVSADLKSTFARLLFAQEQTSLAARIGRRRQDNLDLVALRYEGGREHQGSLLRIRALATQAEFEVSQAERTVRVARRALAQVLGRETPGNLAVAGEFGVAPAADFPDVEALARQTPARLQAAAETRVAESGVDIAKSKFWPDVDAAAATGLESNRWPPDENTWSAGIVLTFPFFSGGEEIFNLQEARAEHERRLALLKSVNDKTAAELESRFAALLDAIDQVRVSREFLEAADLRAEIARAQYTTGIISFQDWDTIENDLIDNQKAMLASLRDAVLAEAAWEQAVGRGDL